MGYGKNYGIITDGTLFHRKCNVYAPSLSRADDYKRGIDSYKLLNCLIFLLKNYDYLWSIQRAAGGVG